MATKTGVRAFGFVQNLRTLANDANELLGNAEKPFLAYEFDNLIDKHIDEKTIQFKNKFGKVVTEEAALYAIFQTGRTSNTGDEILAFYDRPRIEKNWSGITFSTEEGLNKIIQDNLMFRIGELVFDSWQDGMQFLEELKIKSIPEKWSYPSQKSTIPHPILKSYIENTFERLKKE